MERDGLCLDLAFLDVHLVATQHDGDVFADTHKVAMPIRDILVCDAGSHIKHDDTALPLDIISITQSTEFLLTCRVPGIEADFTVVCVETDWVHFDTERGNVLFLKLARQVTLYKGRLSGTAVSNEDCR